MYLYTLNLAVPPQAPVIQNAEVVDGVSYVTIVEGVDTEITCLAADGRPAAEIAWFYDGNDVSLTASRDIVTKDSKMEDAIGEKNG